MRDECASRFKLCLSLGKSELSHPNSFSNTGVYSFLVLQLSNRIVG
jgi:hypothetical protein